MRVGERGAEVPVVMDGAGSQFRVPPSYGDFTPEFWASGAVGELSAALQRGDLEPVANEARRVGAPLVKPEKIVCIGTNYRDHALETGNPIPTEPVVFLKAPNCLTGPYDEVLRPRGATKMDWEVELGLVIGSRCRYLTSPQEALDCVAGYVLSDDVSERAFQLERGGQWDKGKCFETFNPLGPWVATPDEIVNLGDLRLSLAVNGTTRQDGTTRDMIFDVGHVVWYLSQIMVLEPGDLVNTGTPAGVSLGHDDVAFLEVGDVLELVADGLGHQRSVVAAA